MKSFLPLQEAVIRYVATYGESPGLFDGNKCTVCVLISPLVFFAERPTFELVSTEKTWPLVFETEDEKIRFVEELQDLIDRSHNNSSSSSTDTRERRGSIISFSTDVVCTYC